MIGVLILFLAIIVPAFWVAFGILALILVPGIERRKAARKQADADMLAKSIVKQQQLALKSGNDS